MKRQIKFRAWDSISKTMHSWNKISHIPLVDFELEHEFNRILDEQFKNK